MYACVRACLCSVCVSMRVLSMCICVCGACIYVCMYVCVCVCVCLCVCVCVLSVCICVCGACVCACVYVCVCMCACVRVCVFGRFEDQHTVILSIPPTFNPTQKTRHIRIIGTINDEPVTGDRLRVATEVEREGEVKKALTLRHTSVLQSEDTDIVTTDILTEY